MTVAFTVGSDGKVSSASASGMNDKKLDACVVDQLLGTWIAIPDGPGISVSYPLTFAPPP
jgi:hypothetical protein